ncbi:double-strand break repair protein AddB [Thalassobium sp. R2A62]|uniref:double-strand break repair protein AddB n=1 Tax=Thalassobium sp. R2A62 TaxID=633131 RepID=UPI0001B1D0BC|nr:double-strand break repair protein AddB [Thalassobium sp. R2A62]EET47138.1 double-strand break repair protein AddB [Thalassobium sp. R2A62]
MTPRSHVFGIPCGVDFTQHLVDGLIERFDQDELSHVEVYVNTRRMQRRMREIFDLGPARLLPQIKLVTDLARDPVALDVPAAVSPLRRRLEISTLVSQLVDAQPDIAARSSIFDLSDSLANLMEEMQGEGVDPETVAALDVSDQSGHWERALSFFQIVQRYFGDTYEPPDGEARQRLVVDRLVDQWAASPPNSPIVVAGSTGSRGATFDFMTAVAQLPHGMLVLPGFDAHLPDPIWRRLKDALTSEDHPQYRFARLLQRLEIDPSAVDDWSVHSQRPHSDRNRLVSLSLRPAPVTDQWRIEGREFEDLREVTAPLTLIEAFTPREEALAIALRLKKAANDRQKAALITPDRMLGRQVTAALQQWDITPDDSAGLPLQLTAPGRLLRHVASVLSRDMTSEILLTLLKHPLVHTGDPARGAHLLWTRELELYIRRNGLPFPDAETLRQWAHARDTDDGRVAWSEWIATVISSIEDTPSHTTLEQHYLTHLSLTEALATGPNGQDTGELWLKDAGIEAAKICEMFSEHVAYSDAMTAGDYADLFGSVLSGGTVRSSVKSNPLIRILGTLEARVNDADLVILGGLNDGVWPERPTPDPWLNRTMRDKAGLLLPERRIGLSAHDYQQAIGASEVWLTRSVRSDDSETVPSRWVNRLVNLLGGLPDQYGLDALKAMIARGDTWINYARAMDQPNTVTKPAQRPSPCPPISARPVQLSVTRIKTLIRDPYAVYAEKVLGLRPLNPLTPSPDAPLRGTTMHSIFERFIRERGPETLEEARTRLMTIARTVMDADTPWPTIREMWMARLDRIADQFLADEAKRVSIATPVLFEKQGGTRIDHLGFTLTARADRMDQDDAQNIYIYDYKTGAAPTKEQQTYFDKQLLLEAAMVERGGFAEWVGTSSVVQASYIGLGSDPKVTRAPLEDNPTNAVWAEFVTLMTAWAHVDRGYTARRAMEQDRFGSDYDHLSRFGEWDLTQDPNPEGVS